MQQVITIGKDGTMSGLQRKPGQGIDLRQFGKADIKRASLIEWDEAEQAWYIDVLQEVGRGVVTLNAFTAARDAVGCNQPTADLDRMCTKGWDGDCAKGGVLRFQDYDDAVKVEIAYLDALRLSGKF